MIKRLTTLISDQLHQGTTPKELAKATAFGIVIGNFPVLGTTTAICAVVGHFLKLNQAVLQVVNYMMSLSQLVMVPVFAYLGERLTGADHQPFSPKEAMAEFWSNKVLFFQHFGMVAVHAILAWLILAPLVGFFIYLLTRRLYGRLALKRRSPDEARGPASKPQ